MIKWGNGDILAIMELSVKEITLKEMEGMWPLGNEVKPHIFLFPAWLKVWWRHFGKDNRLLLNAVMADEEVIGFVPLRVKGETAQFIGAASICDYLDFIVKPGYEKNFYAALKKNL